MKIEPKDIQVGDRVTLSGVVQDVFPGAYVHALLDGADGAVTVLTLDELAQAEITRPVDPDVELAKKFADEWKSLQVLSLEDAFLAAIKAVRAEGK